MKRIKLLIGALLVFCAAAAFGEDEQITVTIGSMSIADVPFKIETIRTANSKLVKAEAVSDRQVRFTGLAAGKTDVQVIGAGGSRVYAVTVQDNIREVYNAIRKDLDSLPELDISVNRNKIVLKGEVSSMKNWERLHKVLPNYADVVMDWGPMPRTPIRARSWCRRKATC